MATPDAPSQREQAQHADHAQFVRSLRSVRRFASTPIPDDVLRDVLDIGRWTGSSKNTQPWHVVVVRERERLRQLAECGTFAAHLADAAVGLVLVMDDDNRRLDEGRLAQNLMLAAWAYGIGSCIGTLQPEANVERAKRLLEIPTERGVHTALSLGYPADRQALRVAASGVQAGRKPMADFLRWETFSDRPSAPGRPAGTA
jgi:nitroreductase